MLSQSRVKGFVFVGKEKDASQIGLKHTVSMHAHCREHAKGWAVGTVTAAVGIAENGSKGSLTTPT